MRHRWMGEETGMVKKDERCKDKMEDNKGRREKCAGCDKVKDR